MVECPECGTQNLENANFCKECGKKIRSQKKGSGLAKQVKNGFKESISQSIDDLSKQTTETATPPTSGGTGQTPQGTSPAQSGNTGTRIIDKNVPSTDESGPPTKGGTSEQATPETGDPGSKTPGKTEGKPGSEETTPPATEGLEPATGGTLVGRTPGKISPTALKGIAVIGILILVVAGAGMALSSSSTLFKFPASNQSDSTANISTPGSIQNNQTTATAQQTSTVCPQCSGTGNIDKTEQTHIGIITCPQCNGNKQVCASCMVPDQHPTQITCPYCKGSGVVDRTIEETRKVTCPTCSGNGRVPV